jgi:F-type H+-transporting ATPase subunit epsilon
MHTFKLKILTPDTKLFEGEVLSFTVPTQSGEITVLKDHSPLISIISIGEIKVKLPGGPSSVFLVQGGVIDVKQSGEVVVLADQVVTTDKLDNLEKEIQRAKEAMKLKQEDYDFALEESTLERNLFLKRFKQK